MSFENRSTTPESTVWVLHSVLVSFLTMFPRRREGLICSLHELRRLLPYVLKSEITRMRTRRRRWKCVVYISSDGAIGERRPGFYGFGEREQRMWAVQKAMKVVVELLHKRKFVKGCGKYQRVSWVEVAVTTGIVLLWYFWSQKPPSPASYQCGEETLRWIFADWKRYYQWWDGKREICKVTSKWLVAVFCKK